MTNKPLQRIINAMTEDAEFYYSIAVGEPIQISDYRKPPGRVDIGAEF